MPTHDPIKEFFAVASDIDHQITELYFALHDAGFYPQINTAQITNALDDLMHAVFLRVNG